MGKHLRLARLIEMMILIKYHPDYGPKKLARYFEISEKRLYDDLNELNAAGIPIVYNGKGYSFLGRSPMPPVEFTIDETLALWLHVTMMRKHKEDIFTAPIRSASAKLLEMLPDEISRKLHVLEDSFSDGSPRMSEELDRILSAINEAVIDRKTLAITYYTFSRDETGDRKVDPYGVIFRGNSWYMIGHCHMRGEPRTFRVNRIKEIVVTGDIFEYPADFSIGEYVAQSWAVFRGEETEVEIEFSAKLAPLIEEHQWRPDQRIEKHKDGGITFYSSVRGELEIRRWVMSWGEGVRVIRPVSLRREIAAHSEALARAHRDGCDD